MTEKIPEPGKKIPAGEENSLMAEVLGEKMQKLRDLARSTPSMENDSALVEAARAVVHAEERHSKSVVRMMNEEPGSNIKV